MKTNQPFRRLFSGAVGTLALTVRRATTLTVTRAAMTLLVMMLMTATAWATNESVSYIDGNGNSQNVNATVVTTDMEGTTSASFFSTNGWFYVKENVTLNGGAHSAQSVAQNIILGDGATLTVSGGRFIFDHAPSVNIYCQSGGTGKLVVSATYNGALFYIGSNHTLTINGGTVEVTNQNYGNAFSGNLVMNGGTASFNGKEGFAMYAISGTVTLNGGTFTATSSEYAREGICNSYVTIADGKYFKDGSGNFYYGSLSTEQKNALNGVTLTAATQTEYIQASLGAGNDGSAEHPYTISDANGWDAFCLALEDNTTWNGFSGKTVKLDANIEVSRMAGSGGHEFMGNFNGGGNTLTFTATAADNYCAPFRNVKGGSDEDHAITISNLNVKTTITANDFRHAAGLIALQWGHVNVTGCNADVTISSTVGESNPHDLYPAALVSQASSDNGGTLTVTGCTASGTISTDGKYAAGLVGIVQGTASISDCISSVTIDSSTSGDGTHGGIVAALSGVTNIYGTVFNGRLLGENTESVGGFIGWRSKGANIYNSLFIPTEVTVKKANSATFARNDVDTHNCYYTYYLCDGEHYVPHYATDGITRRNGHAPLAVTAGENVTVEVSPVGSPTSSDGYNGVYSVSGITAYAKGITRTVDETTTFYYGQGDDVSLTLSNTAGEAPLGYQYNGFAASAGTLTGSNNPYTLTMPAEDVTISNALAPIDWATESTGADWDNAYMIYNKDQLDLLAQRVNSGTGDDYAASGYSGRYFKLGADIEYDPDVLTIDNDNDGTNESNYEAIGFNDDSHEMYFYFKGHFDGQGHTVSGIRIYKSGDQPTDMYQGLFGYIYSATVENIILADARITGHSYTAGIVGENYSGSVKNCHAMSNVTIHAVQSYACFHGGIVGYNSSTVTGCTSAAAITTADGLTGCYRYGGIAGRNSSTVKNCLYLGNTLNGNKYVGAIAGDNVILAFVTNSYYTDPAITGKDNSGNALDNANCAVGYNDRGTIRTDVFLAPKDDKDNTGFLALMADRNQALIAIERTTPLDSDVDITLNGRTLYKDGAWNTLCLPFALNAEQIAAHTDFSGATLMELNTEGKNGFDTTDGTLYLTFKSATAIAAGVPYLVKWDAAGTDFTSPTFSGVTINATASTTVSDADGDLQEVQMVGCYSPVPVVANDKSILYLGDANTLYYSSIDRDIRSCRAYFSVPYIKQNAGAKARAFRLDFGDGEQTGIATTNFSDYTDKAGAWYDMSGRRLSGKPTKSGVYVSNGRKIVVK